MINTSTATAPGVFQISQNEYQPTKWVESSEKHKNIHFSSIPIGETRNVRQFLNKKHFSHYQWVSKNIIENCEKYSESRQY